MADGPLTITINGVAQTANVLYDSLTITDTLNQPKTCTFTTFNSYQPPVAATVVILRGTIPLFAGSILTVQQLYVDSVTNVNWLVTAINYTFLLRRRRPFKSYAAVSATTVAQDLITSFSSTFTSVNVQAALPTVTIRFDGSQDLLGCLGALATLIGGYCYVDDARDLHFFLSEATNLPDNLDNSNTSAFNDPPLTATVDYSQIRTRDYVVGRQTTAPLGAAPHATTLTVADGSSFSVGGGTVVVNGQQITYTGIGLGSVQGLNQLQWATATNPFPAETWTGVVWAPALNLFVAVSGTSDVHAVATSVDGTTWIAQTPSASSTWQAIAWAPALSLLVAVSSNGLIMSSPDGVTWTARTAPAADHWTGVCWSPDRSLFVAVGTSGTYQIMTSPDGVTWTGRTPPSTAQWFKVVWAPALGLFAAIAQTTASAVMTSPDGITWTLRSTPEVGFTIAWSPTLARFVVTAGVSAMTSPDGITWTLHSNSMPVASASWTGLVWADFLFVATCDQAAATGNVAVSLDGITWVIGIGPLTSIWRSIAWSPTLTRLVAVGSTAGNVASIMTTTGLEVVLTGIPATGAGSIAGAIAVGDAVALLVQRDNLTAQAALAAVEDGGASDGIHEGYVQDASLTTIAACQAAGDADLALFDSPITTVTYATGDMKSVSGKPVVVNRTHPPIGPITLTIQSVTITNLGVAAPAGPIYTVSASSVKFALTDLLTRLLEGRPV
jgi:hypothetical protein